MDDAADDIQRLRSLLDEQETLVERIREKQAAQRDALESELSNHVDFGDLDEQFLAAFADKPYKILPKSENEAYVVVPRFIPFNVGWLHEQDDAWNVFVVNQYVDWIDDLPEDIRDRVGITSDFDEAVVDDGVLRLSDREERDRAWEELGGREGGLYQRQGEREIKIKNDREFDVIASLIDRGNLPFKHNPVDSDDLRPAPNDIDLRDYQYRAWETFTDTGMIGVYWPPGAGKTYLSLYAGERITGEKLVVVPSNTLKEQWRERVREICDRPGEWEVQTYQYLTRYGNIEDYQRDGPALTVYDECHYIPANTFSKLATIDTTYRIGLSASPYREDGRTEYIFALTGHPVGLEWQELVELGAVDQPDVTVQLYRTRRQKRDDLQHLVNERTGNILVFCDSIDEGKRLSNTLNVPFVHGETRDRMDTLRDNRVVIASRVADEGVSIDDLAHVIEYDFHAGSRRQEAQRVGRVMHGTGEGEHIVMMTDDELDEHEKRLYALEEQGFTIRYNRRS